MLLWDIIIYPEGHRISTSTHLFLEGRGTGVGTLEDSYMYVLKSVVSVSLRSVKSAIGALLVWWEYSFIVLLLS